MSAIDETVARASRATEGFSSALTVIQVLQSAGAEFAAGAAAVPDDPVALFAGGCVRDWASGKLPVDLDIATALAPNDVIRTLRRAIKGCGTQLVGKHFGVVRVRPDRDGPWFEVATFREEGPYTDHRHPSTVKWTTRREDARRRDFTVNGLYFDPVSCRVFDDVGGLSDLQSSTLRAIGDPERRFEEDALRLIRAIRFAAREHYTIDPITFEAMRRHAGLLATVSPERIREEFLKIAMLGPNQMARAFGDLNASRLFDVLWRLVGRDGATLHDGSTTASVAQVLSALHALPQGPLRIAAFVGAWFVDSVREAASESQWKNQAQFACRALRLSGDEADLMVSCLKAIWRSRGSKVIDDFRARRCAAHPQSTWVMAFALASGVARATLDRVEHARAEVDAGFRIKPWLNGSELMALGVPEGPALGRMNRWLIAQQLRGDVCDEATAREKILERIRTLQTP